MKKILIIITVLLIASCNREKSASVEQLLESGDVVQLKDKRDVLQAQADSIQSLVSQINDKITELDPQAAKLVKVIQTEDTVYNHYIKLQASIETDQDVQVSPEYGGVMRLMVKEGQNVRKGQLIATISDGGLTDQLNQARIQVDQARAQLQQAEIQRDLAKTTYERQKSLWDRKIGSEMQYLQAKTNYETAQKQVQAANQQVSVAQRGVGGVQSQLAKTQLRAPFSGRVEQIIMQGGQAVSPGTPILRLVNPSTIKAVANVPENYLPNIEKGTKAILDLPALDKTIESEVSLVSASINPGNRTFRIEVPVNDQSGLVKPNLNGELRLNDYSSEGAIVIPESVLREDSKGKFVYVVKTSGEEQVATKAYVKVGPVSNGIVEVLEGLNAGAVVIAEGPSKLQEGDNVKISK